MLRPLLIACALLVVIAIALPCSHLVAADVADSASGPADAPPTAVDASKVAPAALNAPPKNRTEGGNEFFYMTSREFVLSILVFVFGFITLLFSYAVIHRGGYSANDILRMMLLQLIIISTLFCVTAGFSSKDIAPAMGLFGTIAGYLLGRATDKDT